MDYPRLLLIKNNNDRYLILQGNNKFKIGRGALNDLIIDDELCSRYQAILFKTQEGFYLIDLQTKFSTFVNEEKIAEPIILKDGDLIRIGQTKILFQDYSNTKISFSLIARLSLVTLISLIGAIVIHETNLHGNFIKIPESIDLNNDRERRTAIRGLSRDPVTEIFLAKEFKYYKHIITIQDCAGLVNCKGRKEAIEKLNEAGISLEKMDLSNADLTGINLKNANLTEANLKNANLTGANLSGANLSLANLACINFKSANLENVNLSGATIVNPNLSNTKGLTEEKLKKARRWHSPEYNRRAFYERHFCRDR